MRSFEIVGDTFHKGIRVDTRGEPCLRLGAGKAECNVPLSESLAAHALEGAAKGPMVFEVDCVLVKQEEVEIPRIVAQRNPHDERALVKFDCTEQPGRFDHLLLLSACFEEKMTKDERELVERVFQDYRPWPSLGIRVLAEGGYERQYKYRGEPYLETRPVWLFEMLPGSEFIVRRDSCIHPSEIRIHWTGADFSIKPTDKAAYEDEKYYRRKSARSA